MEKENKKWFETKHVNRQTQLVHYSPIKEEELFQDQPELQRKILEHNAKRRQVIFIFKVGSEGCER